MQSSATQVPLLISNRVTDFVLTDSCVCPSMRMR
jgi:hypothetical protein